DAEAYVDAEGRRMTLPDDDPARSVTLIGHGGQRIAALVHSPAVLQDPGLLEGVSSAARLATANARLQADVRARVTEVEASTRRILEAGDAERERLAHRLEQGAEHRLQELREQLHTARRSAADAGTAEQIDRAEHQLDQALDELAELAQGLHPRILTEAGLPGALEFLRERSSVPVEVSIATDGLTPQVEATAYFVCSEALANVGKYAS